LLVWIAGLAALAIWGRAARWPRFDPDGLTTPFGEVGDALVAPAARWDAHWFLSIAEHGYQRLPDAAFFPLYPLLVRALGTVTGSPLVAGMVLSTGAFAVALVLTHRLAALELGSEPARLAVLLTAFAPMAFFFSAVYSESLYLALSLGAFYAARTGRWESAAVLVALCAATRSAGILVALGVMMLNLYGPRTDRVPDRPRARFAPRYAVRRELLGPVMGAAIGLGLYLAYLSAELGDPWAPFRAQEVWFREFAGPFVGVWDGAVAALQGARQLLSGSREHVYFTQAGGDPFTVAGHNLVLFGFLVFGLIATVGVVRRLPVAYGAYTLAALALPLSFPVGPQPLMSLPRFMVVLFPLQLWLAGWLATRPRARPWVMMAYALGLVAFTAQFATWHWVA
jgi:hypothetical protein